MFPWLIPLVGAGIGAMTSKKPLKGALMGGLLGAGGAAAPMLGAGGAAADPLAAYLTTGAAEGSTLGSALTGAGGAAGAVGQGSSAATMQGLLGLSKEAGSALKTAGEAATAANAVQGLFGSNTPMAPQMLPPQQHQDTLAQYMSQQSQLEELRRKARYGAA